MNCLPVGRQVVRVVPVEETGWRPSLNSEHGACAMPDPFSPKSGFGNERRVHAVLGGDLLHDQGGTWIVLSAMSEGAAE